VRDGETAQPLRHSLNRENQEREPEGTLDTTKRGFSSLASSRSLSLNTS
jgi:hypothetical protein